MAEPHYHIQRLTEANLEDFGIVFKGELCENCQCTYFYRAEEAIDWRQQPLEESRRFREAISRQFTDGFVLYRNRQAIGWCQCLELPRAPYLQRLFEAGPEPGQIVISCFLIKEKFRRAGLAKRLLALVLELCRYSGVSVIYALPVLGERLQGVPEAVRARTAHTGVVSMFQRHGFEMLRTTDQYCLMRLQLGSRPT